MDRRAGKGRVFRSLPRRPGERRRKGAAYKSSKWPITCSYGKTGKIETGYIPLYQAFQMQGEDGQ